MSSRAAGPADLRRVAALLDRTLHQESGIVASALPFQLVAGTSGSWLRYLPGVLGLGGRLRIYLEEQRGDIRSVALVYGGHRPEWVVLTLATLPGPGGADSAFRLLSDVSADAARHGIQRVFAATPDRSSAHEAFFQAGFYSYTRESWLVSAGPALPAPARALGRRAPGRDAPDLFRFYLATTPHAVQRAEQLSLEDFDAGRRAGAYDPPHLVGGDPFAMRRTAVLVVGDERGVSALALAYEGLARHPHVLKVRTAAADVDAARDLLRAAARALPPGRPIVSPVRSYEEHVVRALLADGFRDAGTAMLFVKELAIRVVEPALAPAVVR
ncbi:MAG: hypothetical protein Q7S25_02325 [Candidatus Limnocylindria bacterium]|nr:hypothetical protein [Candidatus Limnocylindria bacterium]